MTEAEKERGAIVAWLREEARKHNATKDYEEMLIGYKTFQNADAIESLAHHKDDSK